MIKAKIIDTEKALEVINEVDKTKGILLISLKENELIGYKQEEIIEDNDIANNLSCGETILYRDAVDSREMFRNLIEEFKIALPYGEIKIAFIRILERMYE